MPAAWYFPSSLLKHLFYLVARHEQVLRKKVVNFGFSNVSLGLEVDVLLDVQVLRAVTTGIPATIHYKQL